MAKRKRKNNSSYGSLLLILIAGVFISQNWIIITLIVLDLIGIVLLTRTASYNRLFPANMYINAVDEMNGSTFEEYVAQLLRRSGYVRVRLTPASGDDGIDIIAHKGFRKIGFQCKCYRSNVGNAAVQQAYSGKVMHRCDDVVVVTNRYFTRSAINTAQNTNVSLWNRNKLINMIASANKNNASNNSNAFIYFLIALLIAGLIFLVYILFGKGQETVIEEGKRFISSISHKFFSKHINRYPSFSKP